MFPSTANHYQIMTIQDYLITLLRGVRIIQEKFPFKLINPIKSVSVEEHIKIAFSV